ncbi:peptidoglycan endopeptidase [Leucobacter zeae]|nr:peptidoglycan endopeptidase [Leucobacter zeae]
MAGAAVISIGMVSVSALPSYASTPLDWAKEAETNPALQQTLITVDSEETVLPLDAPDAEVSSEVLEQERKAKAEKEAAARAAAQQQSQQKPQSDSGTKTSAPRTNVPVGKGAEGLVAAARAQIGTAQDCTDLVQNALAAIGMTTRRDEGGYDLGPMDFGRFGTEVAASDVQFGDIMMRGGHVSIYTGDGTSHSAVHGGFGGSTVESIYDADPSGYSVIIRIP